MGVSLIGATVPLTSKFGLTLTGYAFKGTWTGVALVVIIGVPHIIVVPLERGWGWCKLRGSLRDWLAYKTPILGSVNDDTLLLE